MPRALPPESGGVLGHEPIIPEERAQIEHLLSEIGKRWAQIARNHMVVAIASSQIGGMQGIGSASGGVLLPNWSKRRCRLIRRYIARQRLGLAHHRSPAHFLTTKLTKA